MSFDLELPAAGGPSVELADFARSTWASEASSGHLDLTGFDPDAPLAARLAWAKNHGLKPAVVLSRYSSKMQHSTVDQVRDCLRFAARSGFYVPPEFLCVDEAISGRKSRRDGLERAKAILASGQAKVLLVFKVSRLFRVAYKGFQFFKEDIVEENLRAISVSQGIDTADENRWKQLLYLHGMMDDLQIETIADGVRSSLAGLFEEGYVTGALPVGYRRREISGARLTRLGRPRTVPEVDPEVAALIVRHFEWIRDGMSLAEGLRRWIAANGPYDPRSTTKRMTAPAYRRLFANLRYLGVFAFGRKKNLWSSKLDYTRQVEGPESDIVIVRSEELRIVSEELFLAVQERLEQFKTGARGPKARKKTQREVHLWDLVTDVFICGPCTAASASDGRPEKDVRYYAGGAHGTAMRCKHAGLCSLPVTLNRKAVVTAVCDDLAERIAADVEFVAEVISSAFQQDAQGDDDSQEELAKIEKRIAVLTRKIDDLDDRAGEGTKEDRAEVAGKVREARRERAALRAEEAKLQRSLAGPAESITPQRVRELLAELTTLLDEAASGRLGEDVIHKAATAFRQLVGGRIVVFPVSRPGRKRLDVRGVFTPNLLMAARNALSLPQESGSTAEGPAQEVEIWLRRPECDVLAERAAMLVDRDGLTFAEAAAVFTTEGHSVSEPRIWQLRKRYYEMTGIAVPHRPYNNGRPRMPADEAV